MAKTIQKLWEGNRKWVERVKAQDPEFFIRSSKGQQPTFLWIGCSDSRVPALTITDAPPGSIFVHRNIANVVVHTDANLLSVVYYAVYYLKVKHIIVCGHYGCGGVQAAMSNKSFGFLDNWLLHLKDVYRLHEEELDSIQDEQQRWDRFVELNVYEQVFNLAKISFIQSAWKQSEYPYIHGWVYDLKTGYLKDLGITVHNVEQLRTIFQYAE